jgi:hypothetical protein
MFKISTVKIKDTGCKTHRRKANGITNAGTGRTTTEVKRFGTSEEQAERGQGVYEQAGASLLNSDDDDDGDDDDDPKRVIELHSIDIRMMFV